MHVFKSLPPDVLHNIRTQIEATERPVAAALENAALVIQSSEAFQDLMKSGLVPRVTGADLLEFVNQIRRDRLTADASRRSFEQKHKKSALRADEPEAASDDWLGDELHSFFEGRRTAWQNHGRAIMSLGDVVGIAGAGTLEELDHWLDVMGLAQDPSQPEYHARGVERLALADRELGAA